MRNYRFGYVLTLIFAASSLHLANAVEQPTNIDEQATHEQVGLIEIPKGIPVNAFCLDAKGQILTAMGDSPGEIRILNSAGEKVAGWELEIKPEAINTAPDGTILVAGDGKVMRFSPEGKLLTEAESPHAAAVKEHQEDIRKEAEQQLKQTARPAAAMIEAYTRMMEQLQAKEEKGELNEQEKNVLKILPDHITRLEEQKAAEDARPKTEGPSDDKITERMKALMQRKLHVASVSSDGKYVYVAAPSIKGYTFDVWRMSPEFTDAQVVVADLRGCCGHMDVQACEQGLFVAENARHRVACFSADGAAGVTWGKADRSGEDGFTSCCNPMNVCFNKSGDVYTAESNTGRIKRFAADGTFKEFVGDVKLVPGCKNVSIAVSPDSDRVYMLDITRNHIVLMQRKSAEAKATEPAEVKSAETAASTL
ncbi:hypothetical protein LOC68_01045 [Blastopirellula sp. JC732]|uniref:SMP-30/Gluconolactonase/LRE-like region domain-containing protein n=1 Tax=Blastopirellula sediminis TaxID=2894196 RepID=A0A9X1SDR5_9BACT|nr:hypothetical protein [Blastopirellula sediminis]MCC9608227.1 hypothetical protein [Blastopirellula sediminis]MCC9626980.1 hypothetical protein [Blastopirellula sediminis]